MVGIGDEILLMFGGLLIVFSELAFRRTRRLVAKCLSTKGTIVDHTVEEDDGGRYYFAVIQFTDSSGASQQLIGGHGLREPPRHGSTVVITYDLSYPSNAWITGTGGAVGHSLGGEDRRSRRRGLWSIAPLGVMVMTAPTDSSGYERLASGVARP